MCLAVLMVFSLPLTVLAVNVDVSYGDVTIHGDVVEHTNSENQTTSTPHDGSVTVTGSSEQYSVKVDSEKDVTVVLNNVTVDASQQGTAAMEVSTPDGVSVNVELEGSNSLTGGDYHAGLEVSENSKVEITDQNGNGSLKSQGGYKGAGIGGGNAGNNGDITISGGDIDAMGGSAAAGIGGGYQGEGSDISISGGNVTAIGGSKGSGIGGGSYGSAENISISGGTVSAAGGDNAAGIGGGAYEGNAENITISAGKVTATGGENAAGIGGGYRADSENIQITGSAEVIAKGSGTGADVGNGGGYGQTEKNPNKVTVELSGGGSFNGETFQGVEGEVGNQPAKAPGKTRYAKGQIVNERGALILHVFDFGDGWQEQYSNGKLTITTGENPRLEMTGYGIRTLIRYGIRVMVIDGAQYTLSELVKDHDDLTVFSFEGGKVEISG
jgi:hypothetical protein